LANPENVYGSFGEFVLAYVIVGRCFSMRAVIDGNAYIGCENKNWSAFGRRSDHHFSDELHLFGSQHKADRDRAHLLK
jgi:hypothetical protein